MKGEPSGRRRGWRKRSVRLGAAATIIAAVIGAIALFLTKEDGPEAIADRGSAISKASTCEGTSIVGENIDIDCSAAAEARSDGSSQIRGTPVPVECSPAAESLQLRSAMTVEVRVWCSQVMAPRESVEMKMKVWARNPTANPVDVSLDRWYLLVPGTSAKKHWSAPPEYPEPKVLMLEKGPVTAIPANPDGAAEDIGGAFNFATHWKKARLEPGENWRPPLRNPDGTRHLDGTLVFYIPLQHRDGKLYGPRVLGLARVQGRKVVAICPIGRWGRRVSASAF